MRLLIFPSFVLLVACVNDLFDTPWHEEAKYQGMTIYPLTQATNKELQRLCQDKERMLGCAVFDFDKKICTPYVRSMEDKETIEHELKHCAGYTHR